MKKIFVNICSLRDKLLPTTIQSLLDNESGRNVITYGIFEQNTFENSLENTFPDLTHHARIKYKRIEPQYSDGVMWARAFNAMQIEDEEFQYQIDSHMLFDKGWDNYLIFDYNQASKIANTHKVIVTAGTKNFDLEDDRITKHTLTEDVSVKLGYFQFDKNMRLHAHGGWVPSTNTVTPSIHICAGNFFTTTKWVKDVGYHPKIFFEGEEQIMALASILAGYKIYHQRKIKTYHYLWSNKHDSKHTNNPVLPQDRLNFLNSRSWDYINNYIYSLDEKDLEYYREITGVDYINRKLEERAISRGIKPNPDVTIDWEIPDRKT